MNDLAQRARPARAARAKRTLVPPVSQTRTGKGKAKSLIVSHKLNEADRGQAPKRASRTDTRNVPAAKIGEHPATSIILDEKFGNRKKLSTPSNGPALVLRVLDRSNSKLAESVAAMTTRTFLEFFAGGGMARAGLGASWRCLFANDFDARKVAAYGANWGAGDITLADVASLAPADLPSCGVDLAWASFPCQDLSLAGG